MIDVLFYCMYANYLKVYVKQMLLVVIWLSGVLSPWAGVVVYFPYKYIYVGMCSAKGFVFNPFWSETG